MKELRPYQEEALRAIKDSFLQGVRRMVVQAPTGSGKTRLAAEIALGARAKANKVVFVVPAISLIDQTVEMFYAEGVREIGVIQADHHMTDWSQPVQIASIQTVRARGKYPEGAVVILDEVHQLHKAHVEWLNHPDWKGTPFIGLSATPWTKGLGRYFETLLVMSTTKELIQQGYLSKFKTFAADHPDLSGVKTVAGDYHEGQLSTVMQDQGLVANIVKTWAGRWGKDKTFLFGVDCEHAKNLQARFQAAGITCGYQDADTSLADRKELKRAFHNGEVRVISNVGTLTTGVDYDVRCLILARPTKSEMLFVQIIGRALRTAEGKDHALILDHTDTTARLGLVTDIHHERLHDGRLDGSRVQPKREAALPKPCPKCDFIIPVGVKKCPECGYEKPVVSPVYEKEGELREVTGWRMKKANGTNPTLFPYTYPEKMAFYAQLKRHGLNKGYDPKWAKANYMQKFNEWPDWSWNNLPAAAAVGPEVASYIKSRMVAYAMQRRWRTG
jgi:superfamily II DNA or RNA helicase